MKKILYKSAILIALLTAGASASAQEDSSYKPVQLPPGFTSQLNVLYVKAGGWEGKLDLYLPPAGKPVPLIINIHGGGWNKGVKESQTGFNTFFKAGFAVANIEYRLTGQATAPAAVEDTRCALIYLTK
ncbi:MAG: alpha/beta hydrolase, partial [Chitinophagaceae bacterium]